jgi:hypothetical protein
MHGELEGSIGTISYFKAPRFLEKKENRFLHSLFFSF